ncbi:MAG: molybdopterin-dependent oxidoreductase [Actinobacteria bacterium]|nr:molybdopterin-dependent oxidoreductase [Actinomycetota bacterium]
MKAAVDRQGANGQKTVVKGLSFSGVTEDGNCVEVDVADGKIIRIRPLHFDRSYDRKPWTIEARGKTFTASTKSLIPPFTLAYKNRVRSPNRVMFPLKRVDWDPKGERNPQNRGISKYERISWDEATDLIAAEIRRVVSTYGPTAILLQADGHGESKVVHAAHGCAHRLLSLLGGYTYQARNPDSWEGWYWGAKHVWGCEPVGKGRYQSNIIPDIAENTGMLVFAGCDPETTPWGWGGQTVSQLCYWFKELGIKQIYICPDVNYGTAVHADKWIPILPGTDAALYLAIAYQWITEGTYDKEYVDSHVVGFEEFGAYVVGQEDGVPKTPKWAQEKTGVPSRIIKALARAWAAVPTTTVHANGGNMARGPYATENMRMEVCLLGMQGLGKPGRTMWSTIEWGLFGNGWHPRWAFGGSVPVPRHLLYPDTIHANRGYAPGLDGHTQLITKSLVHRAINEATVDNPISWYGTTWCREVTDDQFVKYEYPRKGCSEVHMIWTDTPALLTCWNDSNYTAKAYQNPKIEFMIAQHPWIENDCQFADIILPSATKFELDDIGIDNFTAEFGTLFYDAKCVEPQGESKSDYEVVCAVAEKLGLLEEYTGGKSVEDWIKLGFDTSGVDHLVSWEEFREKGHFVVPNDPNWHKHAVALRAFADDPECNRLSTPTGKLEFYSQRLAQHFPGDEERPPIPKWIERGPSHDERISGDRAKLFPYLVVSNHPRWRVHSQHDDMQWLREIGTCKIVGPDGYGYQPAWIHPVDAEKHGIAQGDVIKVYNERGAVLFGAYVTERIMPGVIYVDHGARWDPIVTGELDRGGAVNTITPRNTTSKNAAGMVTGAFLVGIERANLDELRQRYPEPFERPYHQACGLAYERMLA